MRKTIKFGKLSVGAEFWEKKDKYGHAFIFPLTKIRPRVVNGDEMTAKRGGLLIQFDDDDLVEID